MGFDFSGLLAADYSTFGVRATLIPQRVPGAAGTPVSIDAIDMTEGAEVADGRNLVLQTIKPAAVLQARDLDRCHLSPSMLDGGTIILHHERGDKTWLIESHELLPMGDGDLSGEIKLILLEERGPGRR